MTALRILASAVPTAVFWLVFLPEQALAWGPGTHVALSEAVLGSLTLLPPAIQAVLARYPLHFIYGSVAADISFAKKYAPEGRHCHNWHVGREILDSAGSDALRSLGWGYLSHLAADTIAHNIFVPRQLLLTETSQGLGHTYWEHRMDMQVGEDYMGKARRLVTSFDHSESDDLMNEVLSRTIFSFKTNRRIFHGMLRFQDAERWRQTFDRLLKKSRFDLPEDLVDRYMALSFDYIVGFLTEGEKAPAWSMDPVGDLNLRLAKKARRQVLAAEGLTNREALDSAADEFFPFPEAPLRFWPLHEGPGKVTALLSKGSGPGPAGTGHPPPPPPGGGLILPDGTKVT